VPLWDEASHPSSTATEASHPSSTAMEASHPSSTATEASHPSSTAMEASHPSSSWEEEPVAHWGAIVGTLSDQTDLQTALDAKLSVSDGTLTSVPRLPPDRDIDNLHSIVDKVYVDEAVASLAARYYMLDDDDPTGYKLTSLDASSDPTASYSKSGLSDGELIMGWIQPSGDDLTTLIAGVYAARIFAEKTSGNKTLRLYWQLVERKSDDSEVVIATSNESDEITSKSLHIISVLLTDDYTIDDGSRIVGKIYAAVSGGGGAPSVTLYYEGDEDSAWEIPVNINLLDGRYLKTDQSTPQTVNGGAPTFAGGLNSTIGTFTTKVVTPLLQPSGGDQVIKLGDSAGANKVSIEDVDGVIRGGWTSDGIIFTGEDLPSVSETSGDAAIRGTYRAKARSGSDNRFFAFYNSAGTFIGTVREASTAGAGGLDYRGVRKGGSGAGNLFRGYVTNDDGSELACNLFVGAKGADADATGSTLATTPVAIFRNNVYTILTVAANGATTFEPRITTEKGVVIRGKEGHTANLFEVQDYTEAVKAYLTPAGELGLSGAIVVGGDLNHDGENVGFYGAEPVVRPTITGVRGGGGTANLLSALAGMGLIEDNTTAAKSEIKLPVGSPSEMTAQIDQDKDLRLLFDDTTVEHAVWQFRMPDDYGGNLVAKIQYTMASATSDKVDFEVSVMAVSGGDAQDLDANSYDTANAANATVPGTAGYLGELTITLTNDDDVAAGDYVRIKLERDADDATDDTATGDCEVRNVVLEYEVA